MKQFFKDTSYFRFVGLALITLGILFWAIIKSASGEVLLLTGLYVLFISKLTREDERTVAIKYSSLYIAFLFGYVIKILLSGLYSSQLINFQLTEINHFLILVFALAIVLFYWRVYILWRW
jgi:hypothetical protein